MKRWLCAHVDAKVMRRGNAPKLIQADMERVFGADLHKVVVVGGNLTPDFFESGAEDYVFVNCSNYFDHVSELRRSKVITGVLEDYENPNFCDEAEVERFARSIGPVERDFQYGDLVFVREGYLKGLRGVVVRLARKGRFQVFFRLYTRSFIEDMVPTNLVFEKNVVDHFRFPVTIPAKKVLPTGEMIFPKGTICPDVASLLAHKVRGSHEDSLRRGRNRKHRVRK
jgi:hypothetical protein